MDLKKEWKPLLGIVALFAVADFLPIGVPRFDTAVTEALALVKWYAREPSLRSVDSDYKSRAIKPRNIVVGAFVAAKTGAEPACRNDLARTVSPGSENRANVKEDHPRNLGGLAASIPSNPYGDYPPSAGQSALRSAGEREGRR